MAYLLNVHTPKPKKEKKIGELGDVSLNELCAHLDPGWTMASLRKSWPLGLDGGSTSYSLFA